MFTEETLWGKDGDGIVAFSSVLVSIFPVSCQVCFFGGEEWEIDGCIVSV